MDPLDLQEDKAMKISISLGVTNAENYGVLLLKKYLAGRPADQNQRCLLVTKFELILQCIICCSQYLPSNMAS
jgi:hypothetical protein